MTDNAPSGITALRVRGKPIPIPDAFAKSIASIVIEWSRFETGIVLDTSNMMQFVIVRELATEAPRSFSKKIELWRKSVDRLYPTVSSYRELAAQLKSRATAIAKMRNHIAHGTWDLAGPNAKGEWRVSNMRALQFVEKREEALVSQQTLDELATDIMELSDAIYSFITTKMLHAKLGMLSAVPAPK